MSKTVSMAFAMIALVAGVISPRTASAQATRKFGGISYPAPGNLHWDEGTVELWITPDFDVTDKSVSATLFNIKSSAEETWGFPLMFIAWGGQLAQIGYTFPQQSYVWSGPLKDWKRGQQHYIVWTWNGRTRSLYIDGAARQSGKFEPPLQGEGRGTSTENVVVEGWLHGNLTGSLLQLGLGYSPLTVDEIRVSSVARTAQEIAAAYTSNAAPNRDAYTLLLDHCDGETCEVISSFSGEKHATIAGAHKIVEGRFGKAIQLWTE